MIALGIELLAQQLAMARRPLPVDAPRVEPGRIFAQRLELGAVAPLALHLRPEDGVAGEELERRVLNAADVGNCVDYGVHRNTPHEPHERQRAMPAHPYGIDEYLAAPTRGE